MNSWNLIYENMDRVAFSLFGINVYWYGIAYALALIVGLGAVKYFIKKDKYPIDDKLLESFFIYAEIGIILGARLGYILIYDQNTMYYLTHPWEIFNPFVNGKFVGISGMSYHGAVVGFILGTYICAVRNKKSILLLMDSVAVALPLGYILGRIGNFLNQELVGRETNLPIGILVNGKLLHPSQLYEAFLEGLCIFLILYFTRAKMKFQGELIGYYMLLYSIARFVVEFFREADSQMGYFSGISMGQILSIITFLISIIFLIVVRKMAIKKAQI
ncbi:MAG: prolipoprotein diacylglyceryl transferase [Helicobacteraceae bacterium]|nr:prolipoprotein diacylglyceryl transferase [Helicobacteraceae bacterium]